MSDKSTDILLSRSYDQSPPYWIASWIELVSKYVPLVIGYSIFGVIFVIVLIYGYVELGIEYAGPPTISYGVKEVATLPCKLLKNFDEKSTFHENLLSNKAKQSFVLP
jgi:hypothetical protein